MLHILKQQTSALTAKSGGDVFRVHDSLLAISNAFIIKGFESIPPGQMLSLPKLIDQFEHDASIAPRQFESQGM